MFWLLQCVLRNHEEMLGLIIFFNFVIGVFSQEDLGLSYSFDVDFTRTFNTRRCENRSEWNLVTYNFSGVSFPSDESTKGIRAFNGSCTSSFSIIFSPNSILEVTVLVRTISKNSGIQISVFDEVENATITSYKYRRSNKEYSTGWCTISMPIDKHTKGYITLLGYSLENELIIVDSIQYKPGHVFTSEKDVKSQLETPKSTADSSKKEKANLTDRVDSLNLLRYDENEDELDTEFSGSGDEFLEIDDGSDGSGSGGGIYDMSSELPITTTDTPSSIVPIERPEDLGPSEEPTRTEFWTPLTITIVSVGTIGAVSAIGAAAYFIGKNIAVADGPALVGVVLDDSSIEEDYEEVPRLIPRARSIHNRPQRFR